jgi:hypothetical protein
MRSEPVMEIGAPFLGWPLPGLRPDLPINGEDTFGPPPHKWGGHIPLEAAYF